ncbi:hypothetical protein TELCIR_21830, partial [Teladorsagia circumcincta]
LEVRLCVMQCFCEADRAFLSHLAQPEMLQLQFMSLHDEKLEMQEHVDVTVHVLHAISELCVVGGAEIVRNIDPMFQKLTQLINDSSSLQRREAALRTIGRIARSTAYVVDPYKDYPNLLDDLL